MRISDWSSDVCSSDLLGLVLLAAIPVAGLGALLLVAAGELALTRRLFDSKPSCWPVIATAAAVTLWVDPFRSEEHTSELQSLMRISYAVFCLKKKKNSILKTKVLAILS